MPRIIYILTGLLISATFEATCQLNEEPWQRLSSASNTHNEKLTGDVYYLQYSSLGSHFYHHNFLSTKITLESGEVIHDIKARYNSFLDELVCFNKNLNYLFIIDKYKVKEFELTSPVFGFQKFIKLHSDKFYSGTRYLHVIYDGDIKLLSYYKTQEQTTSLYRDRHGKLKDSEMVLKQTYYTYSKKSGIKKFNPVKNSFYSLYHNNKKEVKKILRSRDFNKLNNFKLKKAFSLIEEAGITD